MFKIDSLVRGPLERNECYFCFFFRSVDDGEAVGDSIDTARYSKDDRTELFERGVRVGYAGAVAAN
jgi:hypothetical protein